MADNNKLVLLHILEIMKKVSKKLEGESFILRSGHATGADQAFESSISYSYNNINTNNYSNE